MPSTSGSPQRTSRAMQVLVVVLLAAVTIISTVARATKNDGIDFYNLWGVSAAIRLSGSAQGTPYVHGPEYLATIKAHAANAGDAKLVSAGEYWVAPDYTGSPLLYASFAAFPPNYTAALAAFQVLQLVSFAAGCLLLGTMYGLDLFTTSCLTLVSLVAFQPLLSDLRVANLGAVQFGLLAGLLALARALPRVASFAWRATLGGFLLAALAALTLAKPNVALITGLLAASVSIRHGRRFSAVAALPVAGVTAALVVAPCVYFGTGSVWAEWYQYVYGSDAHMLVRPVTDGNYSSIVMLSSWLGTEVFTTGLVLLALLGASLVGVAWWKGGAGVARMARRLGEAPDLALAIGVSATMATAPLFWVHYYMIALIPSIWMLAGRMRSRHPARLASLSVVASSGIIGLVFGWLGVSHAMSATVAASWVPLWGAVLVAAGMDPGVGSRGGAPAFPTAFSDAAPTAR